MTLGKWLNYFPVMWVESPHRTLYDFSQSCNDLAVDGWTEAFTYIWPAGGTLGGAYTWQWSVHEDINFITGGNYWESIRHIPGFLIALRTTNAKHCRKYIFLTMENHWIVTVLSSSNQWLGVRFTPVIIIAYCWNHYLYVNGRSFTDIHNILTNSTIVL